MIGRTRRLAQELQVYALAQESTKEIVSAKEPAKRKRTTRKESWTFMAKSKIEEASK